MLDMLLLITTEEPEGSRAISSQIELESRVAVRSPEGAEIRVSLGAESSFSSWISSGKLLQK